MKLDFGSDSIKSFDIELCAKLFKHTQFIEVETKEEKKKQKFHVSQSQFFLKCRGKESFEILNESDSAKYPEKCKEFQD